MKLSELFSGVVHERQGADRNITGLTYNSQKVQPGMLFAAWVGAARDGHTYIDDALARGAAAILCERAPESVSDIPVLVVRDARRALAVAAQRFYGAPTDHLTMAAVTGTNGKTTTVYLLESILTAAGRKAGTLGTLGTSYAGKRIEGSLTTPESVDLAEMFVEMRSAGVDSVAMEVSSHALEQGRVAGIAYDVAIWTNLTQDHLDFHGTMEAYYLAKKRLFVEHRKTHGAAVINIDDRYGARLARELEAEIAKAGQEDFLVTYSASGKSFADVSACEVSLSSAGIALEVQTPAGLLHLHSPLLGDFNVDNILGACAAALALKLPRQTIVDGIAALPNVPGRLERVRGTADKAPLVLVDFAHTPDALEKVLRTVRSICHGRVFCVFGCGGDRDPKKRVPMGKAVATGATWSVLTSDNPRTEDPATIAALAEEGLQAGGAHRSDKPVLHGYHVELDRAAAIAYALQAARADDVVVIAGKGHEPYQIIGTEKRAFDDRQVAREVLLKMGRAHDC